jgi:hypothetical protein
MDQAGAQFFASTALALDQDGDVGFGDHLKFSPDHLHLRRLAEDDIHRGEIKLRLMVREAYSSHNFPVKRLLASSPETGQSIRRA